MIYVNRKFAKILEFQNGKEHSSDFEAKKLPNETNNKTHFAKYSKPKRKEIAERRNI